MASVGRNTDRKITVKGRDQSTKKTVAVALSLPIRTAAILTIYAKAIQERSAYVITELVGKLSLTSDQIAAVDQLVASGRKPAVESGRASGGDRVRPPRRGASAPLVGAAGGSGS